ncbi:MAG TPA: M56 family metallopeptidase [Thermoanaerobaculia bacterium]|nr:M56 family metallopeptidase [Thermoanaerobaculia bacterium]
MAAVRELASHCAGWLWPLLIDHLWEATVVSGAVLLLTLVLRRMPARVRYALCLLASVKFLLPSVLVFLAAASLGPAVLHRLPALDLSPLPPLALEPSTVRALIAVWLAGSVLLAGLCLRRRARFAGALAAGRRLSSGPEAAALARARERLGLRRDIELVASPALTAPGVWRAFRPVLVLPEGIAEHLTPAELDAVLLHELIHVQRWDNLVGNLHLTICCLFWFHPLVWLLDHRLLAEREVACDDQVVRLCGQPEVYARGLLKVLRFGLGWRLAGASAAASSDLKRRLERLAAGSRYVPPSLLHRGLVGAAAALLLALSVAAGHGATARAGAAYCRLVILPQLSRPHPAMAPASPSGCPLGRERAERARNLS